MAQLLPGGRALRILDSPSNHPFYLGPLSVVQPTPENPAKRHRPDYQYIMGREERQRFARFSGKKIADLVKFGQIPPLRGAPVAGTLRVPSAGEAAGHDAIFRSAIATTRATATFL